MGTIQTHWAHNNYVSMPTKCTSTIGKKTILLIFSSIGQVLLLLKPVICSQSIKTDLTPRKCYMQTNIYLYEVFFYKNS